VNLLGVQNGRVQLFGPPVDDESVTNSARGANGN